jgi:hypothetical protein
MSCTPRNSHAQGHKHQAGSESLHADEQHRKPIPRREHCGQVVQGRDEREDGDAGG